MFMILLQNWTEIMHSHLKSGTMLISMPWNQSLILIQIMQTLYGGKTLTPHLELSPYRKKTIRIINNQPRNSHSSLLFKKSNILKFEDKILINNIIFISKSINNLLAPIFTPTIQSHLQLINYLSLHIELTPMEETQLL